MKKYLLIIFVLLSCFVTVGSSYATDPKIAELTKQKLPPLEEPDINIKTLPNGIKVYYLKDTELPVFKITSFFEMGTLYETKPTRGISTFFMSGWRTGGTKNMSPKKIDEELEFVSAHIKASAGLDLSKFAMYCLQKDVKNVLDIYFDLMLSPAFEEDRLEIIRKGLLNRIKQRNEKPMSIAGREFLQSLYGKDSVYSWRTTPETVNGITQDILKKFYQDTISPNRMLIAASSPLNFKDFLKLIDPYITKWTKKLPKREFPTAVKKTWEKSTEFIHKKGNQSSIIVGHFGEKRFSKDKFKLILADEVLGGSTFGSKLGIRIRTDLGLAYSIRSHFGFGTDFGTFRIMTQTKSTSTVQTINEIRNIMTDMVLNKKISNEELELARERILNRLIFELDIPFNMVTMTLTYDYHGYPPHYLTVFQQEIMAVTLPEVKEVMEQYFYPDKLKIMIVGDRTKIPDLDQLEGVVEIPLDNE